MNCYANIMEVKRALRIAEATTTHDVFLAEIIEGISRQIDDFCRRFFYTESGICYFGVSDYRRVLLSDVLAVSAVGADSEGDGTFDGEAWVENTDYTLQPRDKWPKWKLVPQKNGSKALAYDDDYLKITGVWGYGDGKSSSPWRSAGVTVTLADSTTTAATLGTASVVFAGDTLLVGTEQIFIESTSGATATVQRAVNGTTGAAHSAAAASRAQYPAAIKRFLVALASEAYSKRTAQGVRQEMLGTHQVMYVDVDETAWMRVIGAYRLYPCS